MSIHRKIIFEKERQVNTYAHMWHTALILRKTSRNAGKDTLHMNRACLVFIAFSMEAFLNHVGHLFVNSFDLSVCPLCGFPQQFNICRVTHGSFITSGIFQNCIGIIHIWFPCLCQYFLC